MKILDFFKKRLLGNKVRIKYYRKKGAIIGDNCVIFSSAWFGSEPYLIKIGSDVRITNGVKFVTHDGGVWVLRNLKLAEDADIFGPIIIGNNVHIGWDVIIMPNVNIGNNVVIGCGAIVTKDIPDNSVVVGIPAKVIKSIDEYFWGNKDKFELTKHFSASEKKEYLKKKYHL